MPVYQKVNDKWEAADRPHVKVNDVFRPVNAAYVRVAGVWKQAYLYDATPPNPPQVDLRILEDWNDSGKTPVLQTRYLNVGVRLPGAMNDPTCQLIRVCTGFQGKPPAGYNGPTYITDPDQTFPTEGWSNYWYNQDKDSSHDGHPDNSQLVVKQWPRNAGPGTIIKGDTTYYFGAWSQDIHGNWSIGTQAQIYVPKDTVNAPRYIHKEATFQANNSGSFKRSGGWQPGNLVQDDNPNSQGLWIHGQQFTDSIGEQGDPNIISAQIWISREDDNYPNQSANLYLFWHTYDSVANLPSGGGGINSNDCHKIGVISKGESGWYDIPASFYPDLNKNIKGLGLFWRSPIAADAVPGDHSVITSIGGNIKSGQVHVVWNESLA